MPLLHIEHVVEFGDRERAVRERFSEVVAEHAGEQHWAEFSFDVRFGSPGTEVPRYADAVNAGLIVVPSHGYGGVRRLLLGSVAERIIREADCDVLVLRRRDAKRRPLRSARVLGCGLTRRLTR